MTFNVRLERTKLTIFIYNKSEDGSIKLKVRPPRRRRKTLVLYFRIEGQCQPASFKSGDYQLFLELASKIQVLEKKLFKRFKFDCIHHTTAESRGRCWLVYLHNSYLNLCHSMLNLVVAGCRRYLLATWLNSILRSSKRIYQLLICRAIIQLKSSFSEN